MDRFDHGKLKALALSLPDEIEKYENAGLFEEARAAILRRLDGDLIPEMRDRLELELYILKLLPVQFPYTAEQVVEQMRKEIPSFTMDHLEQMDRQGFAEWIWADGEKRYIHNTARNLMNLGKNVPWPQKEDPEEEEEKKVLKETCDLIRREGRAAWKLRVRASLCVKEEAFKKGDQVTVHLPVPSEAAPVSEVQILSHSGNAAVDRPDSVFRSICFRETMQENHPFFVEYEYKVTCVHHDFSDEDRSRSVSCFRPDPAAGEYLKEEYPHIRFTPYLKELAEELKGDETDPVKTARRIYDYITENVKYSFMRIYTIMKDIPDYCARNLRGDCGVQALTFITLCRICGIPAKWQSGLYVHPNYVGAHDWAMFYAEPYGWVPVDPSFGGSAFRDGDETRRDFYFGSQDPFRMAANQAFMQEFFIPKKFWPIDTSDNQTGEAETQDRGFARGEIETGQELISWEKLQL